MNTPTVRLPRFRVVVSSHWRAGYVYDVYDAATGERLPAEDEFDAADKCHAMNLADAAVKADMAAGAERLLMSIFGPRD
jgi:hypothetical protein